MEQLLELLKDGNARTIDLLALEMNTTVDDVNRQLEYLENMGIIKKVIFNVHGCNSCEDCSSEGGHTCKGCLPDGGFENMGQMWEITTREDFK
ncbi:hypothetical protein [Pseudobutyrivibrio xylanivorans]|uniref:Transcriptional regulator HTH-type FeoC domain-containing protein n=1 Tax=Pseudobutyrivibrio xylanivorans TaxID=185007 RepID=A0A5P6VMC9_PSEXY|nr:hypothetical protein [Pseudobutyrivibrio xylanivorans]QFJ53518.1 hypothetical protein FXF36_00850 [Pseudobutyrivibrio xylanivorans]